MTQEEMDKIRKAIAQALVNNSKFFTLIEILVREDLCDIISVEIENGPMIMVRIQEETRN